MASASTAQSYKAGEWSQAKSDTTSTTRTPSGSPMMMECPQRASFQWPWSPLITNDSPSLYSNHERKSSSSLAEAVDDSAEYNPYPVSRFCFANICTDSEFLHPRTPPLPPPAYTALDSKREFTPLEAALVRIDERRQFVELVDRLSHNPQSPVRRSRWNSLVVALLAINLCAMSLIVLSAYMGVRSTDSMWKNAFWCGFTNSLPKSLLSGAFVFAVAVAGMTPFAQRCFKGVWTMLLYSFFLFMIGSIVSAANHGLNITLVVCKA